MNPKDAAAESRVPLHLLPAITMIAGAMACRQGAIDYGPYNWREKPISLSKYLGAIGRHLERLKDGEWIDPKSKQPHFGHIIATSGILMDAAHAGTLIYDLPKVDGAASHLLEELERYLKTGEGNPWDFYSEPSDDFVQPYGNAGWDRQALTGENDVDDTNVETNAGSEEAVQVGETSFVHQPGSSGASG